jgi:hypothetical protein
MSLRWFQRGLAPSVLFCCRLVGLDMWPAGDLRDLRKGVRWRRGYAIL